MMIRRFAYNLARRPRLDNRRMLLRLALLVAAIAAFNLLALRQLALSRAADDRAPGLRDSALRLRQLQQESARLKSEIKGEKKLWAGRIDWANDLIQRKTFPYLSRLDFLERVIPDGVQVLALGLSPHSGRTLTLTLATTSFPQLVELYKRLAHYHLVISSETRVQGSFQVRLQLEYADEAK